MDVIQIRYGIDLLNPPAITASLKERLAYRDKKTQAKTCSIRAFIYPEQYPDQAPKELTDREQKIQKILRFIYEQNEKDPPLFERFPNWRQALVIDCTRPTLAMNGNFLPDDNEIILQKSLGPVALMVGTLAHELKHAEHCDQQVYNRKTMDNLAKQQTGFIDEGIAFIFGNYVQMLYYLKDGELSKEQLAAKMRETPDLMTDTVLDPIIDWIKEGPKATFLDKILGRKPNKNYKGLEQKLLPLALDVLFKSFYKTMSYDRLYPIQKSDKGLDSIPKSFGLSKSYAKHLLDGKLQEIERSGAGCSEQCTPQRCPQKEETKVLEPVKVQTKTNNSKISISVEQQAALRAKQDQR